MMFPIASLPAYSSITPATLEKQNSQDLRKMAFELLLQQRLPHFASAPGPPHHQEVKFLKPHVPHWTRVHGLRDSGTTFFMVHHNFKCISYSIFKNYLNMYSTLTDC